VSRPVVHVNFAADGRKWPSEEPVSISCDADWRRVHELRERYDAVAVGARTWILDRPRLTVRRERLGRDPQRQPARVIFAGTHACNVHSSELAEGPVFLVGTRYKCDGVTIIPSYDRNLRTPLELLYRHGIRSILVEGGPTILESFISQGLADTVTVFARAEDEATAQRIAREALPSLPSPLQASRFGSGFLLTSAAATRFVIFAARRTGSNLLCSLLNSHPEILCHHGLFNPQGIHYALDHRNGDSYLGAEEARDQQPQEFLDNVWRHSWGKRAIGFKFNIEENPAAVDTVLRDSTVRKILLTRRNRIKTYVSERIAEQSGEWESYRGTKITPPGPIRVDPVALFEHVEINRRYYLDLQRILRATGQAWLDVDYESLLAGDHTVKRILSFLEVASDPGTLARLAAGSVKRNPDNLRALIANFAELELELAETELKSDLDADAQGPLGCITEERNNYA
jgi:riboflavin biosynthesis pyrimidine reductase